MGSLVSGQIRSSWCSEVGDDITGHCGVVGGGDVSADEGRRLT